MDNSGYPSTCHPSDPSLVRSQPGTPGQSVNCPCCTTTAQHLPHLPCRNGVLSGRVRQVVSNDVTDASSRLEQQIEQINAGVEAHRQAEARAFTPSKKPEALILRVIGGWENFLGVVNFTRFHVAGYGAGPLKQEELAKGMREVADKVRVRWPHQDWSALAAKAKLTRHKLAHMLYIHSVTGDMPDRTIRIARLGEEGKPRKAPDGTPSELSWRDENWSAQTRHVAEVRERELIEALTDMKWMIDCCRGLLRIGGIIAVEHADLPDHKVIDPFMWQVNWWLPEWGDPETTPLTVGGATARDPQACADGPPSSWTIRTRLATGLPGVTRKSRGRGAFAEAAACISTKGSNRSFGVQSKMSQSAAKVRDGMRCGSPVTRR